MCETNAFVERGGKEELLLENVDSIEAEDGSFHLVNIFGEERKIRGVFKRFSLRENKIILAEGA